MAPGTRRGWLLPGVVAVALVVAGAAGAAGRGATPVRSGPSRTVTITAVGDTELGNTPILPPDPWALLAPLRPYLRSPIVFGNLEGTMTDATSASCRVGPPVCYDFRVPPYYAALYRRAGFTILNSANNHIGDFGPAGVASTSRALAGAGIVQTGLPGQIGVVRADGVRVAFLGFAPYGNTNDLLDAASEAQLVARARREASLVVVYMHAGAEGPGAQHVTRGAETFLGEDRGDPYAFAHAAIDEGADLVIASGPHVLRGMQWYRGRLIDYSLGDFVNYEDFATVGPLRYSVALSITLRANGDFVAGHLTSFTLTPAGEPVVDPRGAAASLVTRLSQQDFGAAAVRLRSGGAIVP